MNSRQTIEKPGLYTERFYRNIMRQDRGVNFQITEGESDLWIHTDTPKENEARQALYEVRKVLIEHIGRNPAFRTSFVPLPSCQDCPEPIREMLTAARIANVGPMAAVAGMVAQYVGKALINHGATHVMVENGGDLFIYRPVNPTIIGLFAGQSPLSMKIGIKIPPTSTPIGVATSSGTVGPSISLGKADAVCVISPNAAIADAAATAIANLIQTKDDLKPAISYGASFDGVTGIAAIVQSDFAAWGAMDVIKL